MSGTSTSLRFWGIASVCLFNFGCSSGDTTSSPDSPTTDQESAAETSEELPDGAPGTGGMSPEVMSGAGGESSGGASPTAPGVGGMLDPDVAGTGGLPATEPTCLLTESGAVTSQAAGEVIENLRIESASGTALSIKHDNVTVRNVYIEHQDGKGITVQGADNVVIENVWVRHMGAPEFGQNPDAGLINIECNGSSDLSVENARLEQGSSGIYLVNCPDSELRWIEGHDFRGPYPRGQVVQWNGSDRGLLEDFSVVNPPGSWPEDNVNIYKSFDVVVRRGLVDGNNAPSGVGVIFDGGTSTGLVEDVDAVRMGNGCFSAIAGGADVVFRQTRCSDNVCEGRDGREAPRSNSLMWAGNSDHTTQRIEDSEYQRSCNGNLVWPTSAFSAADVTEASFTLREPLELQFCWE